MTDSDEEVDHEADVKCEVHLLAGVVTVRYAVFHSLPESERIFSKLKVNFEFSLPQTDVSKYNLLLNLG